MSPRHFARMMESKQYRDQLNDQLKPGMNLWFAFTTVTGLSDAMTKLFVFTPKEMTTNPVKDSQSGTDQSDTNYHF